VKLRGVATHYSMATELTIEADGPLVTIDAKDGDGETLVALTPAQARHAAKSLGQYADRAESEVCRIED
jgi:hypothetical protein